MVADFSILKGASPDGSRIEFTSFCGVEYQPIGASGYLSFGDGVPETRHPLTRWLRDGSLANCQSGLRLRLL